MTSSLEQRLSRIVERTDELERSVETADVTFKDDDSRRDVLLAVTEALAAVRTEIGAIRATLS